LHYTTLNLNGGVVEDRNLEADEERRLRQHETVKAELERDVTDRIVDRAGTRSTVDDDVRLNRAADQLQSRAVDEAVNTDAHIGRARGAARISQVVDYLFFVIYALLGLRALLALMAANSASGFVRFIRSVSDPFYVPFKGIVSSPTAEGGYTLALPILVALVAYVVLHVAINRALRMVAHRKTTV
jgi:YGGT family